MKHTQKDLKYIPDYLECELNKACVSAYNAGIIGGHDLDFLRRYASQSLELFEENTPATPNDFVTGNMNILFEQILFYALSKLEGKQVSCLYPDIIDDDGYSEGKFADFSLVPHRLNYLHLIGGKKTDHKVCASMSRTLFQKYPDYFLKIVTLFKERHFFYDSKIRRSLPNFFEKSQVDFGTNNVATTYGVDQQRKKVPLRGHKKMRVKEMLKKPSTNLISVTKNEITAHERILASLIKQWKRIPGKDLLFNEYYPVNEFECLLNSKEKVSITLVTNPHLTIIEDSFDWSFETKKHIAPHAFKPDSLSSGFAYTPTLFFNGYNEIVIDAFDYNILSLLNQSRSISELLNDLKKFLRIESNEENALVELVFKKLRILYVSQCVCISQISKAYN